MEQPGLDLASFLWYLVNFGILISWVMLALVSLWSLRQRELPEVARVLWVSVLVVPVLEAIAYLMVKPGKAPAEKYKELR
jgi:bacteriorhodopsin